MLDTAKYRKILLDKQKELIEQMRRKGQDVHEVDVESDIEIGDRSLDDDMRDESYAEADLDWRRLRQVQHALVRIGKGTYGRCIIDGKPIPTRRLDAVPWTPYCLKHEKRREGIKPRPTL